MIRRPIFNTRRMCSAANRFKMDRRMNRRYRHRFIRRLRVWLQFCSRVCAQASDDPTPWPSVRLTVAFKFNRDAPKLLLQHRMNRRLDGSLSGSSDGVFQIIQYRPSVVPSAPDDPTGRRCIASVHFLGFLVQQLYWALWDTGWSDAQQGAPSVHPTVQLFRGLFPTASLLC
jgi:hypothetical protein